MSDATAIRDERRHDFFIVDNCLIDEYGPQIGINGVAVYTALARYAGQDGHCHPAIKSIAKKLDTSESNVKTAIKKLVVAGLVRVEPRTKESKAGKKPTADSNIYVLLDIAKRGGSNTDPGVGHSLTQGGSNTDPGVGQIVTGTNTHSTKTQRQREEDAPPPSDLILQVQKATGITSDAMIAIVEDYAARLAAAGFNILSEARKWHGKLPHAKASSFDTWCRNLLKDDRPARASPASPTPLPTGRVQHYRLAEDVS